MTVVPSRTGCPACGGHAEREEEDGLLKWACLACGYEFGFIQVSAEEDCQLGIPEEIRRQSLAMAESRLAATTAVFLGPDIKRRPA